MLPRLGGQNDRGPSVCLFRHCLQRDILKVMDDGVGSGGCCKQEILMEKRNVFICFKGAKTEAPYFSSLALEPSINVCLRERSFFLLHPWPVLCVFHTLSLSVSLSLCVSLSLSLSVSLSPSLSVCLCLSLSDCYFVSYSPLHKLCRLPWCIGAKSAVVWPHTHGVFTAHSDVKHSVEILVLSAPALRAGVGS